MPVSVIIPTRNEADDLPRTLESLHRASPGPDEIIVVDAGSRDATADIAASDPDARLVASPVTQRAAQMNLGASAAQSEIYYFLHADTRIPRDAIGSIERAVARGAAGGGFIRRFDPPAVFLGLTCRAADWRCRFLGWFLGDQSIFVRREAFERLGGFRPMDRFEDLDFSRRLKCIGKTMTLTPAVITSARRFRSHGPVLQTWKDLILTLRFLAGNKESCREFPSETGNHHD